MTVVTFVEFLPPPRADGVPWNRIRVKEAPALDGPWTTLSPDITIVDLDQDPNNPEARTFTVTNALLEEGWYTVTFLDASDNASRPSAPIWNSQPREISWRPAPQDVAVNLLARTVDSNGQEIGYFTDDTRPSDEQVIRIIDSAVEDLVTFTGVPDYLPKDFASARNMAALLAALKVERTFFPDQIASNRSSYPQLYEQFKDMLTQFKMTSESDQPVPDDSDVDSNVDYAFGDPGQVGWGTIW